MMQDYKIILEKFFKSENIKEYSLDKIRKACEYFGNPQNSFKSIHIAGTNGKGSVSKMIFQILKESGKKVGVYTSPHATDIRERFETEDGLISQERFMNYVNKIIGYGGGLSYFERCVLLSFLYFRDMECEYAVIEVGMGGRLDATNIINPILSIITSISYDHMEFLGDTLEKIAYEKGGIIKSGVPVILYDKNPTLEMIANEKKSNIIFPERRNIVTSLIGEHQLSNARIAYEAGIYLNISSKIIESALLHVSHPGRLQYLTHNLLIDGAHNEDGIKKLKDFLKGEENKWDEIALFCNLKKGKQASLILDIFPEIQEWNIIESNGYCICDTAEMLAQIQEYGKNGKSISPENIFAQAQENPTKLFVVFGSLYMLTDFLSIKI